MPLKLCVVGCGQFAALCHGPVQQAQAKRAGGIALAGCCDQSLDRADSYRRRFGYQRAYDDAARMLADERPDALVIAVPPAVTARVAVPLLAAGIPILLEKPPGLNPSELAMLEKAAGSGGTRVQVAFNRRYMPVIVEAKRRLAEWGGNKISRIDYAMVRQSRFNEDFSTTAVHAIDAVQHLAGAPLVAAQLSFMDQGEGDRRVINVEMRGRTQGGIELSLTVLPDGGSNRETAVIHGMGRSLQLNIPASPLADEPGTLMESGEGTVSTTYSDASTSPGMVERMGIAGEYKAFLAGVQIGVRLTPDLFESRTAVALMAAFRHRQAQPLIA